MDLSVTITRRPLTSTLKLIYEFNSKLIKSVVGKSQSNILTITFSYVNEEGGNPRKFLVELVTVPTGYLNAVRRLPAEVLAQIIYYYSSLQRTA